MAAPNSTAPWLKWHAEEAYDYTSGLPLRAWGWEFLRRNPDFQRDWTRVGSTLEIPKAGSYPPVFRLTGELPDLTRWGLLFRGLALH